ncbi:MAG: diaminopimelate epimerase [Flavobacteriales bacterium]|jgi:diaminopimelate epimerase|nr:diaminopimelate epimerase [Flavobacteriales bacterium]
MRLKFDKYQGTGNDFIIIDGRENDIQLSEEQIQFLCDRKFGIGADGLMLLRDDSKYDFKMQYFNSDGRESTMCGNGGRCLAAFAHDLGCIDYKGKFTAIDGLHEVVFEGKTVSVKMNDLESYDMIDDNYFLDTGSPHYVTFLKDFSHLDIITDAHKVRYADRFEENGGTNVNFVMKDEEKDTFWIRTYERGVEDETFSCGTGATAAAIAAFLARKTSATNIKLKTKGGHLRVSFDYMNGKFTNVWLKGPAKYVFSGEIDL